MKNYFYQSLLKEEFAQRCNLNRSYSLRAFAQSLNLDAGTTSKILAGKQVPSVKVCDRLIEGLGLCPERKDKFLASVATRHRSRNLQRLSSVFKTSVEEVEPVPLESETYRVIAEWYHVAILELTCLDEPICLPRKVAAQLGISISEAQLALDRLLQLGLLKRDKDGGYFKASAQLSSVDKSVTQTAFRKNQKQFLEKAIFSLEQNSIQERSHTSMTMAIDPDKLPCARKMISEFNQVLCAFLESGNKKQVYNMSIALYPIQKSKHKGKTK